MKFQKFHLNRIKYLILILLSIVFLPSVKAIVSPTSKFYVNDYANILSEETEQYIMNRSVALNNVDGTQIVVVTVQNLDGMSIEDYSLRIARSFGIGSAEKDNGLLILLSLEERELRTEVGAGLEGIIPDGKSGRLQDEYMIPYLKNNNWDEGIKNGYDAYYKEIVTLNNLNVDYNEPIVNNTYEEGYHFDPTWILSIIGFVIGFISLHIIKNKIIENQVRNGVIYIFISIVLFIISNMHILLLKPLFGANLLGFLYALSGIRGGASYGSSSSSGRSAGGFSSSSHRGGGGSFRGGGSSRRF